MRNASIIVVDDEPAFLRTLHRGLKSAGFRDIRTESDPVAASRRFEQGRALDIALIDLRMPKMDGTALLNHIKAGNPETECIMITAVNDAKTAVNCIKNGAYDYLTKPVSREELILKIRRALEKKRLLGVVEIHKDRTGAQWKPPEAFRTMTTRSPAVIKTLKAAALHADSDAPLLITGASGKPLRTLRKKLSSYGVE